MDADVVFSAVSIAIDLDELELEQDLGDCLGEFEAQYHPSCRLTIWYVKATVEWFPLETASENIFYGRFSVLACYHAPHPVKKNVLPRLGNGDIVLNAEWGSDVNVRLSLKDKASTDLIMRKWPKYRGFKEVIGVGVVVVICTGLAACGSSSQTVKRGITASTGSKTSTVTSRSRMLREECLHRAHIELVGHEIKAPVSMTGERLNAILQKCGAVVTKVEGEPMLEADAKANPRVIRAISEFAACMRQNGVNVPSPNPARSTPLLDTNGINVRSPEFRAGSRKCNHYLYLRDVRR